MSATDDADRTAGGRGAGSGEPGPGRASVPKGFAVALPEWVGEPEWIERVGRLYPDAAARMELAIDLARENVKRGTGGPFGAAVFEIASGRVIAVGVNRVEPEGCSSAHAEVVALSLAQVAVGTYDLAAVPGGAELATSVEPCAMCLGAIPWSGVRRVVCGATDADARAIGFDEGSKPDDWAGELVRRGIEVVTGVSADESAAVLRAYREGGGAIYGPGT